MNELQKKFFAWTVIDEGDYTNDPQDNGGPTRWGITLDDLLVDDPTATIDDVKRLTQDQARDRYIRLYWNPLKVDDLHPAIGYVVFDAGLLHGVYRSAKWLQLTLDVVADGKIGPKTLAAAKKADPANVVKAISILRLSRAKSHPDYRRFGQGWINRITRVKTRALKLTMPQQPTQS